MLTYYSLLGIVEDASSMQIQEAYENKRQSDKSQELVNAYEILNDVEKRRTYDQKLRQLRNTQVNQSTCFKLDLSAVPPDLGKAPGKRLNRSVSFQAVSKDNFPENSRKFPNIESPRAFLSPRSMSAPPKISHYVVNVSKDELTPRTEEVNFITETAHDIINNTKKSAELSEAMLNKAILKQWNAVKSFIRQGAEINKQVDSSDAAFNGSTVLKIALSDQKCSIDVIQFLLNHGANPNLADTNGITPLHIAVYKNKLEETKLLLSYNAVSHQSTYLSKSTPLHIAIEEQHYEIALYLINNASITDKKSTQKHSNIAKNKKGETPLAMIFALALQQTIMPISQYINAWHVVDALIKSSIVKISDIDSILAHYNKQKKHLGHFSVTNIPSFIMESYQEKRALKQAQPQDELCTLM